LDSSKPKEEKILPWIPLNDLQQLQFIEKNLKRKRKLFLNILRGVALAEW